MVEEFVMLERVDATMRAPLGDYATSLKALVGAEGTSLTLYGAVLRCPFDAALQSARSVLVVRRVELDVLRRLAEEGLRFGKSGISAPLIMTPDYIRDSQDTFPLELIEIHQHHMMLFGDDPFSQLAVEDAHVRLQCERELKSILIGLRQGLLAAAGREKVIGPIETDVGEALIRTLRGMLWLKGRKEALPAKEVLDGAEQITDRKLPGVRTALDPFTHHGWDQFDSLYHDVEALGEIANAW